MQELIPYHTHSVYSLLDSMIKIKDYVNWGKNNNMPALALTDHGSMGGLLRFYKTCKENEIKPILGIEAYMTLDKPDAENKNRDNYHIILLAKNKTGWLNLIKLHNLSYYNFYYKPRITFEDLEKYSEGLICLSACIGGIIPKTIIAQDMPKLDLYLKMFKKFFGEDFYLELQDHNLPEQRPINQILVQLSKNYGIKLIATNDAHYPNSEDSFAHKVLLCKQTHKKISDQGIIDFGSDQFYLKNTDEMQSALSYLGEDIWKQILNSSEEIYNKIEEYDILQHEYNYPKFGEPKESLQKLITLSQEGFKHRFAGKPIDINLYVSRLKYEIETIYKIGFTDYFLVLSDLYKFCKQSDIATGYGRGSGAGSLVLYCLGVTHLDPIQNNLLFERFINPDRISAPDVDCDVEDVRRGEVVDYIEKTYGKDKVCNIATYGEMTSVASFKAVASVLEMPFVEANKISKDMIDTNLSLEENMEKSPDLQKLYHTDTLFQKIFDVAKRLEGGLDKRGVHACGVVIANQPLENLTPVMYIEGTDGKMINCSSFEMKEIDGDLKLLKLDILGLKNLSILKDALNRIGNTFDFKDLDFKDEETYKTISKGYTLGVFQMESDLMKKLCKDISPTCLADLSAINAGARPGALESKLTESFINRKKGLEKVDYVCDGMEEYLKETLGTFMYQEQVMQLSRVMAGYTMGQADGLRKIIGKKLVDKLPEERKRFIQGAMAKGHTEARANEIFDMIEKFGRYGFNASHSYAYSALSYATAYLKTHYPLEYMTSLLNANSADLDKINIYIDECYKMNINILPPDINKSSNLFEQDKECNAIRFGFAGIKGVGTSSIEPIIAERNNGYFKSLEDLLNRIPSINKTVVENLIKCGALNEIETSPYKYLPILEFSSKAKAKADYKRGEITYYNSLLRSFSEDVAKNTDQYKNIQNKIKETKDKKEKESLKQQLENIISEEILKFKNKEEKLDNQIVKQNELDILGFSISCNPKKDMINLEKFIKNDSLQDIKKSQDYINTFSFIGRFKSVKKTKNGSYFAIITDDKDEIATFVSKDKYNLLKDHISQQGNYFRIYGTLKQGYGNYEDSFSLESARYFNANPESEIILKYNGESEKELKEVLTNIYESAIINLEDIKYRLSILCKDKKIETPIDYWISDIRDISEIMVRYGLTLIM